MIVETQEFASFHLLGEYKPKALESGKRCDNGYNSVQYHEVNLNVRHPADKTFAKLAITIVAWVSIFPFCTRVVETLSKPVNQGKYCLSWDGCVLSGFWI
jgi:hypothetical protein